MRGKRPLPPTKRRLDPVRRRDPEQQLGTVKGLPREEFATVWANPNDDACGVAAYEARGYKLETWRPGGPSVVGAKPGKEGEAITWRGLYLMSISKAERDADEAAGQEAIDAVEEAILKPGGVDGFRGFGRYARVVNETERAYATRE